MPFAWSPAAIDDLHRLFVGLNLSAAETAEALGQGVTRNAVLGKVQRLGWTRPDPPRAGRPPSPERRAERAAARRSSPFSRVVPLPPLREVAVESTPKLWTEREERECAFPVGEPEGLGMQYACCAEVQGRGDYCLAHQALMRQRGTALTAYEIEGIVGMAARTR
jgi:GcrA cell cycle regulator